MTSPFNPESNIQNQQSLNDEIDFSEMFKIIWKGKWVVIIITFIFAIGSIIYAKSLPNIYKSEALLSPVSEKKDGIGGLSQLGGLASLAGVSLGGGSGVDKTALAIETLKSRDFLSKFIKANNLTKDLFKNTTNNVEPSIQQACAKLQSMITIISDNKTKMIRIAIENESPELARDWVTKLIAEINANMKQRDMEEAKKSIDYLNNQIPQTNLADIKSILFQLIEEQTKTMMLVNVRDEYIFKTVDPAIAPEQKTKPQRSVICIFGTLMGVALSVGLLLFRNAFMRKN